MSRIQTKPRVSQINIYPVKSLGRIEKTESDVLFHGLLHDRCLMLVDVNGQFITQRKYPQLALIKVSALNSGWKVSAPNKPDLIISNSDITEQNIPIKIWKDLCSSILYKTSINDWFSDYLKFPVRLVAYDNKKPRKTDQDYSGSNDIVSFADAFPILVISEASLNHLNNQLEIPVSMARFRPNIVVTGCEAFDEDLWRNITIGNVEFEAVKICSRCILTTIDPETGIRDKNGEPLKTLSQYRKNIQGVKGETGVFFGMNLIPKNIGKIAVGDSVTSN